MVGEMNSAVSLVDFDRMLVDTSAAGGSVAVSRLTSEWFYSKQTINSAIKTLRREGLRRWSLPRAVVRTKLCD